MRRLLAAALVLATPLGAVALLAREHAQLTDEVIAAAALEEHGQFAQADAKQLELLRRAESPFLFAREERLRLGLAYFYADLAGHHFERAHQALSRTNVYREGDDRVARATAELAKAEPPPPRQIEATPQPVTEHPGESFAPPDATLLAQIEGEVAAAQRAKDAGQRAEAVGHFQRALALAADKGPSPYDHVALEGLAQLSTGAQALTYWRKALMTDNDSAATSDDGKHLEKVANQAFDAAREAHKPEEIPGLAEAALGTNPERLPERVRGHLLLTAGQTELELGHDAEAVTHLHQACVALSAFGGADAKDSAQAYADIARAEVRLGRFAEAADHFRDATMRQELEAVSNAPALARTLHDQGRLWLEHPTALSPEVALRGMERAVNLVRGQTRYDKVERAQVEADLALVAVRTHHPEKAHFALTQVPVDVERSNPEIASELKEVRAALHLPERQGPFPIHPHRHDHGYGH